MRACVALARWQCVLEHRGRAWTGAGLHDCTYGGGFYAALVAAILALWVGAATLLRALFARARGVYVGPRARVWWVSCDARGGACARRPRDESDGGGGPAVPVAAGSGTNLRAPSVGTERSFGEQGDEAAPPSNAAAAGAVTVIGGGGGGGSSGGGSGRFGGRSVGASSSDGPSFDGEPLVKATWRPVSRPVHAASDGEGLWEEHLHRGADRCARWFAPVMRRDAGGGGSVGLSRGDVGSGSGDGMLSRHSYDGASRSEGSRAASDTAPLRHSLAVDRARESWSRYVLPSSLSAF